MAKRDGPAHGDSSQLLVKTEFSQYALELSHAPCKHDRRIAHLARQQVAAVQCTPCSVSLADRWKRTLQASVDHTYQVDACPPAGGARRAMRSHDAQAAGGAPAPRVRRPHRLQGLVL
eukprot:1243949-Prymnesium_polylepis.1